MKKEPIFEEEAMGVLLLLAGMGVNYLITRFQPQIENFIRNRVALQSKGDGI